MSNQKAILTFEEARLEIEGAPPYEYEIYIRSTGELRKARCAGGESFSLISANAKALSLLNAPDRESWQILQKRQAIERTYKAFPPELRYVHEHPILDAWNGDSKSTRRPRVLSPDVTCLRVAVQQLLNHGIEKVRAFELLSRILPELAPEHFENSQSLKTDADNLRRRHDQSDKLLETAKQEDSQNFIRALKHIDSLQKELDESRKEQTGVSAKTSVSGGGEGGFSDPLPGTLDFEEIEAWSAKTSTADEERFTIAGPSKET